ncbi:Sporulation factor SpoIIGA [Caloramator mitchellensis]|uniref:Sporulation sigma-E factor-processing peptidase n=1 Tax=Caloramator mitchellensis TaxID=908809 RepID=A0A0R3K130_CALMK|nr:sigma-E processing peptidase SpoIIGA [Caloramator mitchellensis]KRQ86578.1 Sporulation factor SpoIIGA [Caloramator mitchellensis]
MGNILYIDIVFFENLFMNYFLLYLLKRLIRSKAPNWRLVLSALVGAGYVVIILIPNMEIYLNITIKILVSLLMIVIAFFPYTIREMLKLILLFYLETFLIGGSIMAIFYLANRDLSNVNGIMLLNRISQIYLLLGSIIGIIFVKIGFDFIDGYFLKGKMLAELEVFLDNKHCSLKALIDTGNSLRDPLTNLPVIVTFLDAIEAILPETTFRKMKSSKSYDEIIEALINSELKQRVRLIPYKALGIDNGLIAAIRTDKIIVAKEKKFSKIDDCILAIYNLPLSENGEFDALAFPEIIR